VNTGTTSFGVESTQGLPVCLEHFRFAPDHPAQQGRVVEQWAALRAQRGLDRSEPTEDYEFPEYPSWMTGIFGA
jgi:hypothetical protein